MSVLFVSQYALATAVQHRNDTQDITLPSIVQQFPDQFVDSSVFPRAREEGSLVPSEDRIPMEIQMNFTASDREQEQRLAYFREDIGVNMHHWHWHLVYPGEGPLNVVRKDRRGELFYYMHSQVSNASHFFIEFESNSFFIFFFFKKAHRALQ